MKAAHTYSALHTGLASFSSCYPALNLLYKKAGRIRIIGQANKNMALLPAYAHVKNMPQALTPVKNKAFASWKKSLQNVSSHLHKEARQWLQHCLLLLPDPGTKQTTYLMEPPVQPLPSCTQHWHAYRRQIKQWVIGIEAKAPGYKIPRPQKLAQLKAMHQQLGQWHDWVDVLTLLETLKKQLDKADYYLLKQQANTMLLQQQKMVKQLASHRVLPGQ